MIATLQISIDGKWITAGTFEPVKRDIAKGIAGGSLFEYDADFVLPRLNNLSGWRVGLRYPVNFELYKSAGWPAFLLDIFPSGAGRRVWARRLGLKDNEAADWQLLLNGAGNPPGNLRVAEAVIPPAGSHPGFTEEEIIERKADFIDGALFISRFDKMIKDGRLIRHGLETLCSAAGIAEYGRNGAFLKSADGTVMLSPLYDFAPMFLDPEGIPRSSRWGTELEPTSGRLKEGRYAT